MNPLFLPTEEAALIKQPLVAKLGLRAGYVQLATTANQSRYSQWNELILKAALAWAQTLEAQPFNSPRVYWLTLSEEVRHLHIHLYPRWPEDNIKGLPLFEARNELAQPTWHTPLKQALSKWANTYGVYLLD